ncbi:hypothetical protein ACQW5G_04020 [Fructilactobacillus sp. Tb1]|uniref:hypothetical protein n=1 Tax=Fructilactobacillus sp. Tb1 TaxID=3422304 RepID=UPI003D270F9A
MAATSYYQARISMETARLLDKMRLDYEKKIGGNVTKGDCLNRAFEDAKWTENYNYAEIWKAIHEVPMPALEGFDHAIKPSAKILKIQINEDTKTEIEELRKNLPPILGANYVTVGVCIRELLKAAYLKDDKFYGEKIKDKGFPVDPEEVIDESKIAKAIDFNGSKSNAELLALIDVTQEQINMLLDNLKNKLKQE